MTAFGRWVSPALLVPTFVALGCTSLLGIDGNYVSASKDAGGAAGFGGLSGGAGDDQGGAGGDTLLGDGANSNAGGGTESGGGGLGGSSTGGVTSLSSGGSSGVGDTTGSGGTSGAGGTSSTGGASATGGGSSTLPCVSGAYVGTYSGTHKTSTSATFVPVPVSGPLAIQVMNVDGGMPKLAFTFTRPPAPMLPNDGLDAKATVAFDCSKNSGSGPFQSDATFTTTFIAGHGLITGDVQVSSKTETTLKGTWSEHENAVPDFAKGSGTWEATLR